MKTELQVKAELKLAKKALKKAERDFAEHDNSDDMDLIREYKAYVDALKWVLAK